MNYEATLSLLFEVISTVTKIPIFAIIFILRKLSNTLSNILYNLLIYQTCNLFNRCKNFLNFTYAFILPNFFNLLSQNRLPSDGI